MKQGGSVMYDRSPPHAAVPAVAGRVEQFRAAARRVLRDLFNLDADRCAISDETTLLDFAGEEDSGTPDIEYSMIWGNCLKNQIFERYGINCEPDEPLVNLLARLETAEHGVRLTCIA
jgi:hypothetical protein